MNLTNEICPFVSLEDTRFEDYNELVDHLEKKMVDNLPLMELPLAHRITPGLYTREMFAPKGVLLTSKVHTTDHQFIVSQGVILILDEHNKKWVECRAPYHGITKKGTRRIGFVVEDVLWTTMHSTSLVEDKNYDEGEFIKLLEDIENSIIDKRENLLLNT